MTRRYAIIAAILVTMSLKAQNELLGVRNSATLGGIVNVEIDLTNDTVIEHTLLPGFTPSIYVSSTVDTTHSIYYVCDGARIFGVNTITDSLELFLFVPSSGTNLLTCIQYSECDSTIYGLMVDYTNNLSSSISAFHPQDSTLTTLAAITCNYHGGAQGAFDPDNNLYLFENGDAVSSWVGGYDIAAGMLNFNTPISAVNPGILFRGISYDCANARILGLEIRQGPPEIYLSTVDVLTGNLTQVSAIPVANTNYFTTGGTALNHNTGVFYYTATSMHVNSYSNSGVLLGTDTILQSSFLAIETMSSCPCPSTLTIFAHDQPSSLAVFPNPCNNSLTIQTGSSIAHKIFIRNVLGEVVLEESLIDGENINVQDLSPGIYFCTRETGVAVRFIKE